MPYTSVTLAQLQQKLKDSWESVPFWTDPESVTYINEALRMWNLLTGMWKQPISGTTIPNVPWLDLPASMVYNMRVSVGGKALGDSSIGDLDYGKPGWEGQTTASGGGVPTTVKMWAPAGLRLIAIWPAPTLATDIVIDGVASTPVLVNPGDFVDLGEEEHGALIDYALHIATFKKGGTTFAGTMQLYREFLLAAADKNERLKGSLLFRRAMGVDLNRTQRPLRRSIAGQQGETPEAASLQQPQTQQSGG